MKKPKSKKIRKVWLIKPQSRVQKSTKRRLKEKIAEREKREELGR